MASRNSDSDMSNLSWSSSMTQVDLSSRRSLNVTNGNAQTYLPLSLHGQREISSSCMPSQDIRDDRQSTKIEIGFPINHVASGNTSCLTSSIPSNVSVEYYKRRAKNNLSAKISRNQRRKKQAEKQNEIDDAERRNCQLTAELDATYDELAEVMYLIALAKGEVEPEEDDLTDSEE